MLRRFTKKRWVAALSVVGALVVAGAAIAYFTSSGSGSGSATVGSSTAFTVDVTGPQTPMLPGGNDQPIGITVNNPASNSQQVNAVTVKVANKDGSDWSAQADANKPACTAADFTVTQPTVSPTTISGAGSASITGGAIHMNDTANNQDNCQGVTVPLYVSAS